MKILVTGGAGFMGAHVVKQLCDRGYDVVALDDLSGGFPDNVDARAEFIEGSILNHELVDQLFTQHGFEYVYHLAAYAAEGLSHFIRRFNYQNNLVGSVNLVNACVRHEVKCLVFTSSIAVYGANQLPMVETLTPMPEDPYGVAKYAVELDLKAAHEMFGLNHVVFRPHNVYGEMQNIGDKYRNVIGIFMNQIMQGQPMSIFGDGLQTRAFSYIGDVAPVLVESAFRPECYNEAFNIGSDTPRTVRELAEITARVFGIEPEIVFHPARLEVVHAYSSHEKAKRVLCYQDRTTLEEGIAHMAEWAKAKGPRTSAEFNGIEVEKNLPPSWRPKKED